MIQQLIVLVKQSFVEQSISLHRVLIYFDVSTIIYQQVHLPYRKKHTSFEVLNSFQLMENNLKRKFLILHHQNYFYKLCAFGK